MVKLCTEKHELDLAQCLGVTQHTAQETLPIINLYTYPLSEHPFISCFPDFWESLLGNISDQDSLNSVGLLDDKHNINPKMLT